MLREYLRVSSGLPKPGEQPPDRAVDSFNPWTTCRIVVGGVSVAADRFGLDYPRHWTYGHVAQQIRRALGSDSFKIHVPGASFSSTDIVHPEATIRVTPRALGGVPPVDSIQIPIQVQLVVARDPPTTTFTDEGGLKVKIVRSFYAHHNSGVKWISGDVPNSVVAEYGRPQVDSPYVVMVTHHGVFVFVNEVPFAEDDVKEGEPQVPPLKYNLEKMEFLVKEGPGPDSLVVQRHEGKWQFGKVNTFAHLYCNAALHKYDPDAIVDEMKEHPGTSRVKMFGHASDTFGKRKTFNFSVNQGFGLGEVQEFTDPMDTKEMDPKAIRCLNVWCTQNPKNEKDRKTKIRVSDAQVRHVGYGGKVMGLPIQRVTLPPGIDMKAQCVEFLKTLLPDRATYAEHQLLDKEAVPRPGLGVCLFTYNRRMNRVEYAYNDLVAFTDDDGKEVWSQKEITDEGYACTVVDKYPENTELTDEGQVILIDDRAYKSPNLVKMYLSNVHVVQQACFPFTMVVEGEQFNMGQNYYIATGPGRINSHWKELGTTPDGKMVYISKQSPELARKPGIGGPLGGEPENVAPAQPMKMITASKRQLDTLREEKDAALGRAAAAEERSNDDRKKRRKLEGQLKNVTKQAQEAIKSANQATREVREQQYTELTARVKRAKLLNKLAKKPNGKTLVINELEKQAKGLEKEGDEKGAKNLRDRKKMYEHLSVVVIRKDTLRAQEELVEQAKRVKEYNDEADAAQAQRVSNWKFDADSDSEDGESPMDVDENLEDKLPTPADPDEAGPATGPGSRPPPSMPDVNRAFSATPPPDPTQLTGHMMPLTREDVEEVEEELETVPPPQPNPRRSARGSNKE